jgi:hypothetical protein
VQRLLGAKRDLRLEKELAALDSFVAVILDDIGYVQQSREEMEVLFTFLSERYERKSVIITSNLLFSEWDRIFKDPMTTAAAIDRLVHHAVILEMTGPSIRNEEAKKRGDPMTPPAAITNKEPSGKDVDEHVRLSLTDERRGEKRGNLTPTTPGTISNTELSGKEADEEL